MADAPASPNYKSLGSGFCVPAGGGAPQSRLELGPLEPSLDVLPLRYAVLPADAAKALPGLPSTLGKGVTDLTLKTSQYGVRFLRSGCLYVLLCRAGKKIWNAYAVSPESRLYSFEPDQPSTGPTRGQDDKSYLRSIAGPRADAQAMVYLDCIRIEKAESTEKAYFLFTPFPVLSDKLSEYAAQADSLVSEGKMQIFHPRDWVGGSQNQPHSLPPDEVSKYVPEYVLREQGATTHKALAKALVSAGFPTFEGVFESERLSELKNSLVQSKGAVFVVHDPIGITQELNDYRNEPMAAMHHSLQGSTKYGPNEWHRFQVYQGIEDARSAYLKGVIQSRSVDVDRHYENEEYRQTRREIDVLLGNKHMGPEWLEARQKEFEEERAKREKQHEMDLKVERLITKEDWEEKYASRLDHEEMDLFKQRMDKRLEKVAALTKDRAADHIAWYESDRLVDAFDIYGQSDAECYCFAYTAEACSVGVSGTPAGEELVSKWATATSVERKNLFMRGFLYNKKELIKEVGVMSPRVKAAVALVDSVSNLSTKDVTKLSKGLVNGFASVDAAFDEAVRAEVKAIKDLKGKESAELLAKLATVQKWRKGVEAMCAHKLSDITRAIFRSAKGGTLDKAVSSTLGVLLFSRLGKLTEKIGFEELFIPLSEDVIKRCKDSKARRAARRNHDQQHGGRIRKLARQEADEAENALNTVIQDARDKAKAKIKNVVAAENDINNFHHVRIGLLLGFIEAIALFDKIRHYDETRAAWFDICGSVFSLVGNGCNMIYTMAKSVPEIAPYANAKHLETAVNQVRGGWKLAAGSMNLASSTISVVFDGMKWWGAIGKDNALAAIYGIRMVTGGANALLSACVASSYAQPWLVKAGIKGWALKGGEYMAKNVVRWRLMLLCARLNWVGLALTAIEIGYLMFSDDDLMKWMDQCVFRKDRHKKDHGFSTWETEIEALQKALVDAVARA